MEPLAVTFFGQFGVRLGDKAMGAFRTQKALALLVILAAEPHSAHRRESLMTMLWPGMPDASARQNLRQVLYHLRQAIPAVRSRPTGDDKQASVALVLADRRTIQLNPAAEVSSDIVDFETHMARSEQHEHLDLCTCSICYETLSTAVTLWQGEFLADFYLADSNEFEAWAETTRQYYRRKVLDALETVTMMAMRRSAYVEARAAAERQIAIDDLRESAYRQLMEILAANGRRGEALAVYETLRRRLFEALGMGPAGRTTELYERILAGETRLEARAAQGARGYDFRERIGTGAYGEVFRAVQPTIDREVAVKVIHQQYADDAQFIRRFEFEAQMVARLEHPHIVPLYDYWREPQGAYLVMRLLRGGSLADALADGPWGPQRAQSLLDQLAAALHAAHRQGIVHRDIKPANILFDESGYAYLSDFGIAADLSSDLRLTLQDGLRGTPDYVSPEQLDNAPVSAQTDIYSLGAVLYEVLSGAKPFPKRSALAVMQSHLSEALPPVCRVRPELPEGIDAVIQRATAKLPAERFGDALEMALAFRNALDKGRAEKREQAWVPANLVQPANPYKGLRAYQEADAGDFYGRDSLTMELVERLADSRFLAVVGPSGSGKSSVVRAGLLPALRAGALPGSESWYIVTMTPASHPLEELELALWPVAVDPPPSLIEPMQRDLRGILRTIRRILPEEESGQLLLFIDQFEELYTMVSEEERHHFLNSLLQAIGDPRTPLRVVITLRADFYDRPLSDESVADLFRSHTALVLPLTKEELAHVIREPANGAGVRFDEGVVTAMVAEASNQPGVLPLVQYALTELFEKRSEGAITLHSYAEIGGVTGALRRRADAIYDSLSAVQKEQTRQMFLRLVTIGEGVEDTKRRIGLAEFAELQELEGVLSIVEGFAAARLLILDRDSQTRQPTVEVAHEALLREWERLRRWLDESRDDVRLQRRLAISTAEWEGAARDRGYLLRGARLSQYEAWRHDTNVALTQSEHDFLAASSEARQQRNLAEEARTQRELQTAQRLVETERQRADEREKAIQRLRRRALLMAGALGLAALLAMAALFAWRQAGENAALAERSALEAQSLALASGAQAALAGEDTDQALMLALAANEIAEPPALAQEMLYEAAMSPGTRRRIETGGGWLWAMDVHPPTRRVASGGDDNAITISDLDTGEELAVLSGEHSESLGDVAFTPDGKRLLSGSYDDTLILWDLENEQIIRRMQNPTGDVNGMLVSPRGDVALAATEGGVATLWDIDRGELLAELVHNPQLQIINVAFSDDGSLAATASEDGSAVIWDVSRREALQRMQVLDGVLFAVAFTPDGQTLAAGGQDNAVRLYDVHSGEQVGALTGLPDWVFGLEFTLDGSRMLTASRDGAVMLWDMETQDLLRTFVSRDGRTLDIQLVDEGTAVSSSSTGSLRVWDLLDHRLEASYDVGDFLVSSANGSDGRLVALGLSRAVRIANLESGQTIAELTMPEGRDPVLARGDVTALAFDPAGERLLAANDAGDLVLWDIAGKEEVGRFVGHESRIHDLAFTPDGRAFLSAADDRRLILWEVESGEQRFSYTNPSDTINSVAFSEDGELFAAGMGTFRFAAAVVDPEQMDTSIRVWETATGQEVAHLEGHEGPVTALAFSPDGRLLSGSIDTTLRLWDVQEAVPVQRYDGHTSGVASVALDEDGRYAASGSSDGGVVVWDVDSGDLLRQFAAHEGIAHSVTFVPGNLVRSAAEDGAVKMWSTALDRQELLAGAQNNRHIPKFTCEQRARYGLRAEGQCE